VTGDVRKCRWTERRPLSVLACNPIRTLLRIRRLRLENYAHFEEGMQTLARRARVLGFFRQDAAEKKESALLVYIQQQLEYAKIWKLLEFSQVLSCADTWACSTVCISQATAPHQRSAHG